jgi:hypothetical protein
MSQWLILRTDFRKEHYVASQIINAGYKAWVPSRIVVVRTAAGRRITAKAKDRLPTKEYPLLPGLVFAAVPVALEAELMGIKGLESVEHTADYTPALVPQRQIEIFMEAVDAANAKMKNYAAATMSKKEKAAWVPLQDLAAILTERARAQLEQAA